MFQPDLPCEPVREDHDRFFRVVQQYFQFHDLQTAFEARKSWFDRMDGTAALLESELQAINRNLEQLINLQREKVSGLAFEKVIATIRKFIANY